MTKESSVCVCALGSRDLLSSRICDEVEVADRANFVPELGFAQCRLAGEPARHQADFQTTVDEQPMDGFRRGTLVQVFGTMSTLEQHDWPIPRQQLSAAIEYPILRAFDVHLDQINLDVRAYHVVEPLRPHGDR